MTENTTSVIQGLLILVLGWSLGLLGPLISSGIRHKFNSAALMKAIQYEIRDIRVRLAGSCFILTVRYGDLDRELLRQIHDIFRIHNEAECDAKIAEALNALIQADDPKFEQIKKDQRARSDEAQGLKIFSMGLIDTNLYRLADLPIQFQRRVHDFRNRVSIINQEISRALQRVDLTFDSSISAENHKRLHDDIVSKYQFIARQMQLAVNSANIVIGYKQHWIERLF